MNDITERELYLFSNENETVVAFDSDDAIKVWEETLGEMYSEDEFGKFEQLPDYNNYTLYEEWFDDQPSAPDKAVLISHSDFSRTWIATCRAWADARGRCYLGSSEY